MAEEQLKANSSPAEEAEQTEEDIHILKKVRMEKRPF